MVEKAPFGGPLTVDVSGIRHALGVELASRIRVEAAA
jgi:Fe2+ transport system protein FeoA